FLDVGDDAVALFVGVGVAEVHWRLGAAASAVATVRALVPIAERTLGPQWWAPDTLDAAPFLAGPAARLATLLARSGEPMPAGFVDVTTAVEGLWGGTPSFKITFIRDFAAS